MNAHYGAESGGYFLAADDTERSHHAAAFGK